MASYTMAAVLVRPQAYLLAMEESRNITLNNLFAWSLFKKARLCFASNTDHITFALFVLYGISDLKKEATDIEVKTDFAISLCLLAFFPHVKH